MQEMPIDNKACTNEWLDRSRNGWREVVMLIVKIYHQWWLVPKANRRMARLKWRGRMTILDVEVGVEFGLILHVFPDDFEVGVGTCDGDAEPAGSVVAVALGLVAVVAVELPL